MDIFEIAFLSRILGTLIFLLALRPYIKGNYLLIAFVLYELDGIDSLITGLENKDNVKTFAYKIHDKVADAISYFFAFMLFPIEKEYLYFLLYRVVGIILFGLTRNINWIIICPDMMKEYLVYSSIYKGETSGFPLFIPVKMVAEKWMHTVHDVMQVIPLKAPSHPPSTLPSQG